MKQENVCVHITTEKQLNSSRFTSKITVLCHYYQNTNPVVCFFLQLPGCWSYEEEINCEYALLRGQNMMYFSSRCLLQPVPLPINFQLFFYTHMQPPPLPFLFCAWECFTVEILSRKNKHQWLNKLCYHFDVLLKKVCQRKFKLGNSTKIRENKSLIKIHR